MTIRSVSLRLALAACLLVSAFAHGYLYVHGYQHIPVVGPGFLLLTSVFVALAILIAVGGPDWLAVVAAVVAAGSVVAFGMSRTVGLFGFVEKGWQPAPYAVLSLISEILAVLIAGAQPAGQIAAALRGRSAETLSTTV